ncbi:class I lanthipeptide [Kordia aestuariivivens]|uniref:class I lanthipeptide n=1 Tax=Kordia aestuariivivens TaxID=2759037 RepID=UPI001655256B
MKKKLKTLSLKKSVVSELNANNSNAVKGGMTVRTQADTLCTSNAIICQPSVNFSCQSVFIGC